MIVSNCCGAQYNDPGYPDNDICGACGEHSEGLPTDKPSVQVLEMPPMSDSDRQRVLSTMSVINSNDTMQEDEELVFNEEHKFQPWQGRQGMLLAEFPYVQLDNGLVVCNFSSFHTYQFNTGEILGACTKEVADMYKLTSKHSTRRRSRMGSLGLKYWTDVSIKYHTTNVIMDALNMLHSDHRGCDRDLDIILVPFLLMDILKGATNWDNFSKLRTCKKVDPRDISQGIFSDKFCI